MAYIYGLKATDRDGIRYIGMTDNLDRRLKAHLSANGNSDKSKWVRSLHARGGELEMVVLDEAPKTHIQQLERDWIEKAKPRDGTC